MHSVYSQYRCVRFRRGKSVVCKAFFFLTACLLRQITQTSWHLFQITLLKFQRNAFSLIQLTYILLAGAKNVNLSGECDYKKFKKRPLPSTLLTSRSRFHRFLTVIYLQTIVIKSYFEVRSNYRQITTNVLA